MVYLEVLLSELPLETDSTLYWRGHCNYCTHLRFVNQVLPWKTERHPMLHLHPVKKSWCLMLHLHPVERNQHPMLHLRPVKKSWRPMLHLHPVKKSWRPMLHLRPVKKSWCPMLHLHPVKKSWRPMFHLHPMLHLYPVKRNRHPMLRLPLVKRNSCLMFHLHPIKRNRHATLLWPKDTLFVLQPGGQRGSERSGFRICRTRTSIVELGTLSYCHCLTIHIPVRATYIWFCFESSVDHIWSTGGGCWILYHYYHTVSFIMSSIIDLDTVSFIFCCGHVTKHMLKSGSLKREPLFALIKSVQCHA